VNKGFYLPQQIGKNIVDTVKNAIETNSLNLGLFLDKYVLWYEEKDGKMNTNLTVQVSFLRKIDRLPGEVKKLLTDSQLSGKKFKNKIMENEKLSVPFEILPIKYYESYRQRMENLIVHLKQMGYSVMHVEQSLNWRLLVNLGAASVYEASLLFHRNYSIPYIPGSAVKGATRHWSIQKFVEELRKSDISYEDGVKKIDLALENGNDLNINADEVAFRDLIRIFGTQNKKGDVIFFNALPVLKENKDFVVLDIMNVHYGDYYRDESGKTPPGDWMNPTPVFFLAVEKGTKFKFTVISKNSNLANKAINLLKEAINKIGIGAKTSAGYGYFEVE